MIRTKGDDRPAVQQMQSSTLWNPQIHFESFKSHADGQIEASVE
jgi:hypothetical protein